VEDKHWINSSSAMVWEKGVETAKRVQTRRDLGLHQRFISSLAHGNRQDIVFASLRMLRRQKCLNHRLCPFATNERARQSVEH
jgi:hypothetical protein